MIPITFTTQSKQSGASLMVIIIVIAISAVVLRFTYVSFANFLNGSAHYKDLGQVDDIRGYVRSNLNCISTLSPVPSACSSTTGAAITVKKQDGTSLIAVPSGNTFTRTGETKFALRGWCKLVASKKTFTVEINRLNRAGTQAVPDSFTNKLMNGQVVANPSSSVGWTDLFKGVPICVVP